MMKKDLIKQATELAVNTKTKVPTGSQEMLLVGLKEMVTAWKDFKKVEAVEITKRKQIEAWRQTQLEKIQAQEGLISTYLSETFKERKEVFHEAFARLDTALNSLAKNPGDATAAAAVDKVLVLIVGQVQTSPLAGLNDLLKSLEDDTGTITI